MELKHDNLQNYWKNFFCINRTFMELKPKWQIGADIKDTGINRTFMELKPSNGHAKFILNLSINRTFMELKPIRR